MFMRFRGGGVGHRATQEAFKNVQVDEDESGGGDVDASDLSGESLGGENQPDDGVQDVDLNAVQQVEQVRPGHDVEQDRASPDVEHGADSAKEPQEEEEDGPDDEEDDYSYRLDDENEEVDAAEDDDTAGDDLGPEDGEEDMAEEEDMGFAAF